MYRTILLKHTSKPTLMKITPLSCRYYRNRRNERDSIPELTASARSTDQNHSQPDTLAYIKQHETALYSNNLRQTPGNPGNNPQAGVVMPSAAEFAAKQDGLKAKWTFLQRIRFAHPMVKPMLIEEDLPMIIESNDPKVPPQLFLPRSTYPLYRIWDVPDVIPIPRKDAIVPFLTYTTLVLAAVLVSGVPKVVDYTKDAEKKHLILQQEVKSEEKQLNHLHSQMTIEEIVRAMGTLPRKPGEAWNPDEEGEMERLSKRVFYPN